MPRYRGSCHCGAITFAFEAEAITDAMRCNCSICRRKGAALSSFTLPREALEIAAEAGRLATYQFGTHTAKHHFCTHCGIHPFVETRLTPGHYRVNLGCLDELDSFALPVTLFDGTAL